MNRLRLFDVNEQFKSSLENKICETLSSYGDQLLFEIITMVICQGL